MKNRMDGTGSTQEGDGKSIKKSLVEELKGIRPLRGLGCRWKSSTKTES
jgi:hypothetical protein